MSVVVLEKGSEPGAHILSGAIMDPKALTELIPDWRERGAPLNQPVTDDAYIFLSEKSAFAHPTSLLPPFAHNHGNYIVSLGNVTKWLARAGRSAGRGNLPRLCRRRGAVQRRRQRQGRGHRQPGHQQGTNPRATSSSAWNCTPSTPCLPKARAATWANS
jgi:hypothetical protein